MKGRLVDPFTSSPHVCWGLRLYLKSRRDTRGYAWGFPPYEPDARACCAARRSRSSRAKDTYEAKLWRSGVVQPLEGARSTHHSLHRPFRKLWIEKQGLFTLHRRH